MCKIHVKDIKNEEVSSYNIKLHNAPAVRSTWQLVQVTIFVDISFPLKSNAILLALSSLPQFCNRTPIPLISWRFEKFKNTDWLVTVGLVFEGIYISTYLCVCFRF